MYYTIYKITNQINGKFYIGTHKTNDLNDDYMGSGKYLKHAQEKYGIENFTKEILFVFDTPEAMYDKEAEIVNEDFIAEENTYNIKIGGFGGFDYINKNITLEEIRIRNKKGAENFKERLQNDKDMLLEYKSKYSSFAKTYLHSAESKAKAKKTQREKYPNGTFGGKHHTDEHKEYMSVVMSERQSGVKNSQYGTRWIYSIEEKISKKINKNDPLPEGWKEGRKIKFGIVT